MGKFLVAYDLHGIKGGSVYESIIEEIEKSHNGKKVLETTFLLEKADSTVSDISSQIMVIFHLNGVPAKKYDLVVVEWIDHEIYPIKDKDSGRMSISDYLKSRG